MILKKFLLYSWGHVIFHLYCSIGNAIHISASRTKIFDTIDSTIGDDELTETEVEVLQSKTLAYPLVCV